MKRGTDPVRRPSVAENPINATRHTASSSPLRGKPRACRAASRHAPQRHRHDVVKAERISRGFAARSPSCWKPGRRPAQKIHVLATRSNRSSSVPAAAACGAGGATDYNRQAPSNPQYARGVRATHRRAAGAVLRGCSPVKLRVQHEPRGSSAQWRQWPENEGASNAQQPRTPLAVVAAGTSTAGSTSAPLTAAPPAMQTARSDAGGGHPGGRHPTPC